MQCTISDGWDSRYDPEDLFPSWVLKAEGGRRHSRNEFPAPIEWFRMRHQSLFGLLSSSRTPLERSP